MSWIANAEAGSSVRGKLNALMIPLSSGTITTPVEFFDVTLPSGYQSFSLSLNSIAVSDGDFLAAACGVGSTFFNDAVNLDTYSVTEMIKSGTGASGDANPPTARYSPANDALMDFGDTTCTDGTVTILPGDAGLPPRLRFDVWFARWGGVGVPWTNFSFNPQIYSLNPMATVPPVLGRITKLRFLPVGTGAAVPTSGHTVTGGSWALFGIPDAP